MFGWLLSAALDTSKIFLATIGLALVRVLAVNALIAANTNNGLIVKMVGDDSERDVPRYGNEIGIRKDTYDALFPKLAESKLQLLLEQSNESN